MGVGLEMLSRKIREHFEKESTQHRKLNTCCRLIGEQAISLARFSFRLIESLHNDGETIAQKCKMLVLAKLCQMLRDMGSIFNKLEVTQSELTLLKELGKHVLFLGRESLTNSVWTVAHAIPYFAQELYDKYKVGYAILSMQGKESNNAGIKESLAHSNRSCLEEGKNKWHQVFVSDYVRNFYIPEFEAQPDRYHSHFVSRTPDFCRLEGYCECGQKYDKEDLSNDDEIQFCTVCDDEFMHYVTESASTGEFHEALFEIFLPHACEKCDRRFSTFGLLSEHLNTCASIAIAPDNTEIITQDFDDPTDF